ncbi:imm11 family protein [Flocculibacter collagenilyticus]|uniref:imm11 family protein n=1 Tax=Flocculibacter collagenilyticus TaxID=2744479 RepID=UPI0018F2FEE8|nr:DUF1629 domain-containing protein [Flocculibacter collagenilyticus]
MTKFNDEYYIASPCNNDEDQSFISVHKRSEHLRFNRTRLISGAPFFVEKAFQERDKRLNINCVNTDIMFGCGTLIMNDIVKSKISQFEISGTQLYPSILIDSDNRWHENYWYLNIWERLDCWSRNMSVYEPAEDGDENGAIVDRYHLDSAVLNDIPEPNRLIFRMGGESFAHTFFHKKIVDIFEENNFTGIRFFKVSEYESGDEF